MSDTGIDPLLADTADGLFAEIADRSVLADAERGVWQADAWRRVSEMGFADALLPEASGGAGLDPVSALALVRIAGRHALPLPLAETMAARWFADRAGLSLPEGPATFVVAPAGEGLALTRQGDGWRLSGTAARVPWGRQVVGLVVIADVDGVSHAARPAPGGWTSEPGHNLAGEPRDTLRFDTNAVTAAPLADGLGPDHARAMGAALRVLAMAGALEAVLTATVAHAGERVQFGRPIGRFQAIQQSAAVLAGHVAAASGAADLAAEAVAGGLVDLLPIAVAKVRVGEAASAAAAIAHQIHGAIGITREHALHFLTMRLWSWREEYGAEPVWARLVGRRALAAGGDGLWPLVTAV